MSTMRLSAKMDRTDNGTPWGFRMTGGKDFGAPLVVQRVTPGSLAAKCGLQVDDTIVRIGATPTDSLRHKDAQQRIMDSGNSLELALERGGGGYGGHTDNYGYAPSPPMHSAYPGGSAAPYNAGPKPYGDSYNSVGSLTSHTASLAIGSPHSGTVDSDTAGMLHAGGPSLHDDAHALTADTADVVASDPPPHANSDKPVVPPSQSAVYEEPGEDGRPVYRGFRDPNLQSQTFKKLMNLIQSGEDVTTLATQRSSSPVQTATTPTTVTKFAVATKPTIAPKPKEDSQPVPKEDSQSVVKCDTTVRQADVGREDTVDVHTERKTIVIPSRNPPKPPAADSVHDVSSTDDGSKVTYHPSETFRLVQEQDSGVVQSNVSPLTGVEIKTNQSKKLMMLDHVLHKDDVIDVPVERKTVVIPSNKTQTRSPVSHPPASHPASQPAAAAPRPGAWQPQIPTGPRKMRVGKAGEAKSLPAVFGGARIPLCNACGTAIRGPFISALDKTWCPDHFICANPHCRTPLVNCGFVEEEGQLFCEKDYELYFAPHCGNCGRAIVGTVVSAMGQKFHPECFTCFQCHKPIRSGLFHLENGQPYCDADWAVMFQTKCYGCQFPIEPGDRWVEALSQNWHSECFNCSTCQVNLEGQSFFAKGGKPYCKKHSASGRF